MPPNKNKLWKKPKYVKLYESGGRLYAYYRRQGLEFKIEGEPGTMAWLDNYEAIHQRFHTRSTSTTPQPGTLAASIVDYKKSDRFMVLADSTRRTYHWHLGILSEQLGHLALSAFTRRTIVRLQAKIAEKTPKNAVERIKLLKNVFETACDLGEIDINPAKGVRAPVGYKPRQFEAWTDEQIETFLAGARPVLRRAAIVALYTGLRRSDLVRLRRGDIKDGWLVTSIKKTDGFVEIPIHSDLAEELTRVMPAASLMLAPTVRGKAWKATKLSDAIREECLRLGIEPNPPLHGLRRNAIIRLLEAGCSREEVMSITDQSERMVKHYAGRRHKRTLAKSAIFKLEQRTKNKSV